MLQCLIHHTHFIFTCEVDAMKLENEAKHAWEQHVVEQLTVKKKISEGTP